MNRRTAKTTLTSLSLAAALALIAPATRAAEEQGISEVSRATVQSVEQAASATSGFGFERLVERPLERLTNVATTAAFDAANAATTVAVTAATTVATGAATVTTAATAVVRTAANVATTTAVNAATVATTLFQTGRISFYADKFHGRPTASGTPYDAEDLTMAHRTLPLGTKVMITNTANQRSVVVTVNDRGPFTGSRVADLSRAAAEKLNMIRSGIAEATIHILPSSANKQDGKAKDR